MTLFVGKNGAGKSTILDAVAVAASTFLCGIDGGITRSILKEDARYEFYEMEGMVDAQHQFPVLITAKGECDGQKGVDKAAAFGWRKNNYEGGTRSDRNRGADAEKC